MQIRGRSGDQRRGMLPYREKEEVGRACFEQSPLEERDFRVVIVSHWLSCGILLLAEPVWEGEILPSSCWSNKVGFFLLVFAIGREW